METLMDNKYCLDYLKKLLKTLACDKPVEQKMIPKEIAWNMPLDIASDWDYENIRFFVEYLIDDNIISNNTKNKFQVICNNFQKALVNGRQFDRAIWTTDGFEHHPFWIYQRKLAKDLLNELDNIQL